MNKPISGVLFVLINGMWERPSCWNFIKQRLESLGCSCIAPSLKYHDSGINNPHENLGTTSILDFVVDLEKKIEQIRIENPVHEIILIGHSMGGLLAQILLTRNPDYYYGGIFLTPAPPAGINSFRWSILKCFYEVFNWGCWRKPFKLSYEKFVYSMYQGLKKERQQDIIQNLQHESGKAACEIGFWQINVLVQFLQGKGFKATTSVNFNLPHQMLFVGAQNDKITPVGVVKNTALRYKNAQYREVPDAPHHILEHEKTIEFILEFITSNPSPKKVVQSIKTSPTIRHTFVPA